MVSLNDCCNVTSTGYARFESGLLRTSRGRLCTSRRTGLFGVGYRPIFLPMLLPSPPFLNQDRYLTCYATHRSDGYPLFKRQRLLLLVFLLLNLSFLEAVSPSLSSKPSTRESPARGVSSQRRVPSSRPASHTIASAFHKEIYRVRSTFALESSRTTEATRQTDRTQRAELARFGVQFGQRPKHHQTEILQ